MDRAQEGQDRMIQVRETELNTMLDRAAEYGANKALEKLGLENGDAAKDIQEIRCLAQSIRQARSTVWQTIIRISTVALLAGVLAAIGIRSKLFG